MTVQLRYRETRERSAELLRLALAHMGQHDAAFNPVTFTVWYEYAGGGNPRLTEAIDELLRRETRLGDETIARLFSDHLSEVDQVALQRVRSGFQTLMSGMADSAARTGDQAGVFRGQLDGLSRTLGAEASTGMALVLQETLAGTAVMRTAAEALQQQVVSSRAEIERLQVDLSRARDEAMIDSLTRAANRAAFDRKLEAMLVQAPLDGRTHCLVMMDIDHFKVVNDSFGHVMGDRVLQAVCDVLAGGLGDPAYVLARYGGEEFALLLPQVTLREALELAEASCQRVKAMKLRDRRSGNVVLTVTISAGVTALQPQDDAQSFVERADSALYLAKGAGRDCVRSA